MRSSILVGSLALVLSGLVSPVEAQPHLQRPSGERGGPVSPGARTGSSPAAATTATSAATSKSASELLTLSATALARASSYQYSGPATVTASGAKSGAKQDISGAWQKPSQTYTRSASAAAAAKGATLETYTDGAAMYVKVSGGSAGAGAWVKSSQSVQAQGNPFAMLQLASQTVSTVTQGANVVLNGKEYLTVTAVLNQEAARALLGNLLTAAGYQPATTGQGGKVEASITYHIDPKTFLSEVAKMAGSQTVSAKRGGSVTVKVAGDVTLKGVDQPVTMPDVSSATQAQKPPGRRN